MNRLGLKTSGADPKRSNWQVLAYPGFRRYFAGSTVSNFGTWLQNTAQVLLAYQLTHSVFWVGMTTCAQFSSPLILGPWAGVLIERFGHWQTLILTQCAAMATTASLAALQFGHALTTRWLLAGALATGLSFTFASPALPITIGTLVPLAEIKRALAMDSVSYNLGRALAPILSVFVLMTVGAGWVFTLNSVSYGFFTVILLGLQPRYVARQFNRSRILNGLRIAVKDWRILVCLLMVAAVTVADDPISVLGPGLARSMGVSATWSGMFIAALGAGNVFGSLAPTRQVPSVRRAATMLGVLSLSMMVFVTALWIWLSVAAAFLVGVACLFVGATMRTLLLHYAGPGRQSAVMAAWMVAWAGSKPIASCADGTLVSVIGMRPTGILLAMPALVPAMVLLYPALEKRFVRKAALGLAS